MSSKCTHQNHVAASVIMEEEDFTPDGAKQLVKADAFLYSVALQAFKKCHHLHDLKLQHSKKK